MTGVSAKRCRTEFICLEDCNESGSIIPPFKVKTKLTNSVKMEPGTSNGYFSIVKSVALYTNERYKRVTATCNCTVPFKKNCTHL